MGLHLKNGWLDFSAEDIKTQNNGSFEVLKGVRALGVATLPHKKTAKITFVVILEWFKNVKSIA